MADPTLPDAVEATSLEPEALHARLCRLERALVALCEFERAKGEALFVAQEQRALAVHQQAAGFQADQHHWYLERKLAAAKVAMRAHGDALDAALATVRRLLAARGEEAG